MRRPRTVCLLPIRNGAHQLHAYLDSATRVADDVVALDDGSTDDSLALLRRDRRVSVVLENPRRPGFTGWDDGMNRTRLLEAAGPLRPDWILWLDADELIPPDDAAALREFIAHDALPGCAYGFLHYRMWGERYDPHPMWIYRMFSFRAGQVLRPRRLHFTPIPTEIPRSRWIRTTIRFQHLGAIDEQSRLAHVAKYDEADPPAEYGRNFGGLAAPPGDLERWQPRAPDAPVLLPTASVDASGG